MQMQVARARGSRAAFLRETVPKALGILGIASKKMAGAEDDLGQVERIEKMLFRVREEAAAGAFLCCVECGAGVKLETLPSSA